MPKSDTEVHLEPIAYDLDAAAAVMGVGKTKIYDAIRDGKLIARKWGARTVVTRIDAEVFLQSLPVIPARTAAAPATAEPAKVSPLDQLLSDQITVERNAIYGGKPPATPMDEVTALSMTSRHKPANSNASASATYAGPAGEDI